jgi:hypothetical protein
MNVDGCGIITIWYLLLNVSRVTALGDGVGGSNTVSSKGNASCADNAE